MNYLLTFCLSCSFWVAFGQETDTLFLEQKGNSYRVIRYYFPSGALEREYFERIPAPMETYELSPEELFMRGAIRIPNQDKRTRIDSIATYYEKGKIRQTTRYRLGHLVLNYVYDVNWKLLHYTSRKGVHFGPNGVFIFPDLYYRIIGRIGDTVDYQIPIENQADEAYLLQNKQLVGQKHSIAAKSKDTLHFQFPVLETKTTLDIPLQTTPLTRPEITLQAQVLGYHIHAHDFTNQEASPLFQLNNIHELLLYNTSTEKMLLLLKNDREISRQSIGSIINRINLRAVDTGLYTLVLVDLQNNTRKYVQIQR